ncbi:MAG: DEAD/DEAH box helicase [Pseudomonadota bacterium]
MAISQAQRTQVLTSANSWARSQGFGSASEVPFHKAAELIQAVSSETKISAAKVRDALLEEASAANEVSAGNLDALGGPAGYRGTADHTPLRSDAGVRPMAALMDAKSIRTAGTSVDDSPSVVELSRFNTTFKQCADDFEATRVVVTRQASTKTLHELAEASGKLLKLFGQLDGSRNDKQVKEEILKLYDNLLSDTARRKGVFLTKSTDSNPISSFVLDKKDEGPHLPDAVNARRGDSVIGSGSSLGVDAQTGRTFVLDYQGEVTEVATVAEFVQRREEQFALEHQAEVVASDPKALEELRSISDKGLARLGGEVEYVSLVEDDKNELTRVYPTKWHREKGSLISRRIVSEGPFAGIFLDDLVHELTRRQGSGTHFDPKKGQLPTTPRNGEPFVTTTTVRERGEKRSKLFIKIPDNREWTEARRSLRRLSELEPSVKYREGSGNTTFVFAPEQYKLVRDIVGQMVVNGPATTMLEEHFAELTRVEMASSDKSLGQHTAAAIGGFRGEVKGPDGKARTFDLSYWQKKSLAWLEARDHKGVIALDTGMGKTLVAVGMMRELQKNEGVTKPFLVVGPPGLGGNMETEIRKFCEPAVAEELCKKLVVMDYREFSWACRKGEHEGKPFAADKFGAVFFDEAQWIKNRNSVGGKAALAFKHPHKVVLTKSVMKDSVDDVFTLSCIANNIDLNDRTEGKEQRYLMRKFRNLYTNVVGGRCVGVKEAVELAPGDFVDPKHNMHAFIKQNFLHADKRIDDVKLPRFQLSTEALAMPPKMEEEYRATTAKITKLMRGMVSLYRDQGVSREYIDDKGRTRREINPLAKNKKIAEVFGRDLHKLITEINTLSNNRAKLDRAAELVFKHLEASSSSRTVLFSDSAEYVLQSAQRLSEKVPGKVHAACLAKEIRLFQNGKELKAFQGHTLPFKPTEYTDDSGRTYDKDTWHKFVLDKVIAPSTEVASASMFGPVYQEGQNMQWADVGIHLDRDTWSRQNTEQREGRLWRKGQKQPVHFYNLDWTYKHPQDELDRSLDEVRGMYEKVSGQIFHDIIVVPQKMELGEEWAGTRESSDLRLDASVLEFALDPSIKNAAERGGF